MTSDDVIHSWWVPEFSVKQDANPGFINEAWTKVRRPWCLYRGNCAELCGKDHAFMPIVVEVLPKSKPKNTTPGWLNKLRKMQEAKESRRTALLAMQMSMDELMTRG